jgi:hypothetical protein
MTPPFDEKLRATLTHFVEWSAGRTFSSCRLVHYCGVDRPHAIDVAPHLVLDEITGCLAEGFAIGWHADGCRLYLSVQEPDCPVPPRDKVLAEAALADVDAMLREAGFDPET